ncbi:MAG: metal ABC transporter substrate-binding protein [Ignavibacteria bacterium]|nr:metal ABC transporter substrate-binding protein [Ignavibacteria bacterium]
MCNLFVIVKISLVAFLFQLVIEAQPIYVTTIHPFKEILKSVVGEQGKVICLLPPGSSPHTFNVTPSEVKTIETADALFYGAEHLDEWSIQYSNPNKIELLNFLPVDSLLYIFTIRNENVGTDPHFWTDPLLVKIMLPQLTAKLCSIDPDGCKIYEANAEEFSFRLEKIHNGIIKKLNPVKKKTVILSHPFFQYFLKQFNFTLAGIIEPIPGKEPTPKELKEIIDIAIKNNVKSIFTHIQLPDNAAHLLSESTGIKVYTLDPVGGVEGRQTYEEILKYNADIILKALK